VGCKTLQKKRNQEWLNSLLSSKFFGSCLDHTDQRKNEKNVFCIDCNLSFCKHCVISSTVHCLHRRLQICRYVYHDVVRLQDIQKHLDCSKIQTYKINGEKAVHLNPRPQCGDTKPSKTKGGAICEACKRHIQDFPNRFCSIACKVLISTVSAVEKVANKMFSIPNSKFEDFSWKGNSDQDGNSHENESSLSFTESTEELQADWLTSILKPKKQLHKRKGFPRRAPLS
ncbi:hypothetical protein RJ639_012719, partial [Escallonia herrerae]